MTIPGSENDKLTPPATSPDAKTTQILDDIAQTRAEMSGTLGELHERLAPSTLKEKAVERIEQTKEVVKSEISDAKQAVRDATLGRVETAVSTAQDTLAEGGRSVLEFVRENPIPLALTAVGLGWLLLNGRNRRSEYRYAALDPYDLEDTYDEPSVRRGAGARRAGARVKRKVSDITNSVEGAASDVAGRAGQLAQRAQDSLRGATDGASARAARAADEVRYRTRRVSQQAQRTYFDNPLVVGAAVAVAGTVVGLALPLSQREEELLGGAREGLRREARGVARGAIDRMQEVARHIGDGE